MEEAYEILAEYYQTSIETIKVTLDNAFILKQEKEENKEEKKQEKEEKKEENKEEKKEEKKEDKKEKIKEQDIILPFCNLIYKNKCNAIVYNHGLYTQCTNESNDICRSCKKLKYGVIQDRIGIEKDKFIISNGKKEISYEKFMEKMNYTYEEVCQKLEENNLSFNINVKLLKQTIKKKNEGKIRGRGRPKMVDTSDSEEEYNIDVKKMIINEKEYYITCDKILLDIKTKNPIGLYKDNKIIEIPKLPQ